MDVGRGRVRGGRGESLDVRKRSDVEVVVKLSKPGEKVHRGLSVHEGHWKCSRGRTHRLPRSDSELRVVPSTLICVVNICHLFQWLNVAQVARTLF